MITTIGAFFDRHAWKMLVLISVIMLFFGLGDYIRGGDADPAVAESITGVAWETTQEADPTTAELVNLLTQNGGAHIISLALFSVVICIVGYRKSQRWAWYSMWVLPLWDAPVFFAFSSAERQPTMPDPAPLLSAPIFLIITALVLVLSSGQFFSDNG